MAERANAFEPEDSAAKGRAIEEARAEFSAGKGVPHDRVRAWLKSLLAGRKVPPPR